MADQEAYAKVILGLSRQDADIDLARSVGGSSARGGGADVVDLARGYALTAQREQFPRSVARLQRFLVDGVERCLIRRGYVRFALTRDQRRSLARRPPGSEARFRYLHSLASDGRIVRDQSVPSTRDDR